MHTLADVETLAVCLFVPLRSAPSLAPEEKRKSAFSTPGDRMDQQKTSRNELRLAELIAALSLAIDLGMGQPMEHFMRACLLAMRLANALNLDEQVRSDVYYLAMLRHLGCTAHADVTAAIFGDDIAANTWLAGIDQANPVELLRAVFQQIGPGQSLPQRMRQIANVLTTMPRKGPEVFAARCEVGQRLAERLGLSPRVKLALGQVYERWDGKGLPNQVKGETILLSVRVIQVAQDAELFYRLGGKEHALTILRRRAKGMYDAAIVTCFCQHADSMFEEPGDASLWEAVLAAEPGAQHAIPEADLESTLHAVADFVDLKSVYTLGHSSGVAALAEEAVRRCGLPEADARAIRYAALLHDLGRIGIPTSIWEKPGSLTETEWERVRLHPYYTERILVRSKGLAALGALAAAHHERIDGSGYHRAMPASLLSMSARILAVADVYHALCEPRPHRPAQAAEAAADELRRQVRAGRLDAEAVHAVLLAAGHRLRAKRHEQVAGLSDREIEVLRLVVRGQSNSQVATLLSVSERTVHHHIEHIYNKIGVSTRAAAALFAMQHNLLEEVDEAKI